MVFFPAVQAVLNSSEPRPDTDPVPPSGIVSSISSSDAHVNTSARTQAQAGPGPSTTTNSARFTPMHVSMSGTMAPPQGPIRKQNIACDACRSRKIRCQRVSIYQICEQCEARGSECTSRYVEQLASKQAKKKTGIKRRRKSSDEGEEREVIQGSQMTRQDEMIPNGAESQSSEPAPDRGHPAVDNLPHIAHSEIARPVPMLHVYSQTSSPSSKQNNLLCYLFAPGAVLDVRYGYDDTASIRQCETGESDLWEEMGGEVWTEAPSPAHLSMDQDAINDLADDLLDTYYSIVHIRLPILEPEEFRARFSDPEAHPDGPLYHPLLAVALAWGARFSDHPIIAADREEMSKRRQDQNGNGPERSRLVQMMVIRAREVAEANKAFRIASLDNVRLAVLMESLLAQAPFLKDRYQQVWVVHATRHFTTLRLNTPSGLVGVADETKRSEVVYMWWLMCLADGFRSAFHRLRPATGSEYFDVELQEQFQATWEMGDKATAMFGDRGESSSTQGPQEESSGTGHDPVAWLRASHDGSTTCRMLCDELWIPRVREKGIPIQTLRKLLNGISGWRDTHLSKLGVPTKWPEDWDFLATITTCSTDVYIHCLWLVLAGAIRDFGVVEAREMERGVKSPLAYEVEGVLRRCREEADHSAMRIAALAAVLTENAYLRLDTLVIYHPIYEAGLYLARQGKQECLACFAGLKQYSVPFPSIWCLAQEIETVYINTRTTRPGASLQGVGHLPPFLPALTVTPRGSNSTSGSGPSSTEPIPIQSADQSAQAQDQNQTQTQTQTLDWSSQSLDLLANSQAINENEHHQPISAPTATATATPNGNSTETHRDLWPDGTPMPSRDIAWNLFDWTTLEVDKT